MRHNQNARRPHGRGNGGSRSGGGGGGGYRGNSGIPEGRRVNPRVQTFDSNGPEVRIRGTAYQINEKYVALARDVASAGDRVLAESYLQHAEHYQRFINEMTEEFNAYNQQNSHQQPPQQQAQPPVMVEGNAAVAVSPETGNMSDLDQGFLVGPRVTPTAVHVAQPNGLDPSQQEQPQLGGEQPQQGRPQQRDHRRSGGRNFTPRRTPDESGNV